MNCSVLFALMAGTMLPLQAVVNARLGRSLGSPLWAAAVSGAVTTIALVLAGLATTHGLPRGGDGAGSPAWSWIGGLCGALALAAMTATVQRLGAAAMISMVMTGQAVFSLVIDRYGLFGSASAPITARRVIAVCLLIAGAALFSKRTST